MSIVAPRRAIRQGRTERVRPGAVTAPQTVSSLSLPLPVRLGLIFALLLGATLLAVAGVSLAIARSHLERALDNELAGSARSFQGGPAARARGAAALEVETRRWLAEHPLPAGQMAAMRIRGGPVLTSAGGVDLFEVPQPQALLRERPSFR